MNDSELAFQKALRNFRWAMTAFVTALVVFLMTVVWSLWK